MFVNEIFRSIQGEGLSQGLPTTFVRFAGCSIRCKWCDTPYAQSRDGAMELSPEAIIDRMRQLDPVLLDVCLTGGEPLIQPRSELEVLISRLCDTGTLNIAVETNGACPVDWLLTSRYRSQLFLSIDYKLSSSGVTELMIAKNFHTLRPDDVLKFVCQTGDDVDQSVAFLHQLAPVHTCRPTVFYHLAGGGPDRAMAEFVLRISQVFQRRFVIRYGVQLHKLIWGSERAR
jgi:7-carboxy-7-deazaguanine synthase